MKNILKIFLYAFIITSCQNPEKQLSELGYDYTGETFLKVFEKYIDKVDVKSDDKDLKAIKIFIDNDILQDTLVHKKLYEKKLAYLGAAVLTSKIDLLELLYNKKFWTIEDMEKGSGKAPDIFTIALDFYCKNRAPKKTNIKVEVFEYLISKGYDVNKKLDIGPPLLYAVRDGKVKLAEMLLKNGADPNYIVKISKNLEIPLVDVVINMDHPNKLEILRLLLKHKATLKGIVDKKYGRNILMDAIVLYNKKGGITLSIIKQIIEADKSLVNTVDKRGKTPLMYAINANKYRLAELLLQNGADPNFVYKVDSLKSPFIFAAIANKQYKYVKLLLKYGANLNGTLIYKNKKYTFIQMANKMHLYDVKRYILKHKPELARETESTTNDNQKTGTNNEVKYKTFATIYFHVIDAVTCVTKSKIKIKPAKPDARLVNDIDSYYRTCFVSGDNKTGVKGWYVFSWSLVDDCGLSKPTEHDYRSYAGKFMLDGLHDTYDVYISDDLIEVKGN